MITREVTIRNIAGFHIRPAQLFTEQAVKFQSQIHIQVRDHNRSADGKSIFGLMTLGLSKGVSS